MNLAFPFLRVGLGFDSAFLSILFNTPLFLSVTQSVAVLHLGLNVVALYGLSLAPLVIFYSRIIDARQCSRLFSSVVIGLVTGALGVLLMSVLTKSFFEPVYTYQLLVFAGISTYLLGYDTAFFRVFHELDEGKAAGKENDPHLSSPRVFSGILLSRSIFSYVVIVVLLLTSNYALALGLFLFQAIASLAALRIHRFLVKGRKGSLAV